MSLDYLIIGAGPAGLACAIEAQRKNLDYVVVDKGCITDAIYRFPADLVFFSTPDRLAIGDALFITESFRPTRIEVLNYYRSVVDHYGLKIAAYEKVESIKADSGSFNVHTLLGSGEKRVRKADKVIVATGYYDHPNMLGIQGEDLPKVSHYYTEAHPYHNCDVAIIGGKNSAVEAALAFCRAGARVTMIHRGATVSGSVKYWVRPDIDKKLEAGEIKAMFDSEVVRIKPDAIEVKNNDSGDTVKLKNDFVFALTGYHPGAELLTGCGARIDSDTLAPEHNLDTLETSVPGLYVAGSIVAGKNNNKVFIENSREHGKKIV
ncbi:Thioredoxin reductase [hydrothermal vent metagenome]|uniref:Thioredoxin reductase n=1 Tax=hydrothermal vent metagenome TaxID=652676 RepID=A0A3B1BVN0_9ZZZZ